MTSYKVYILAKRNLPGYRCLDSWIRQEYAILEANRVQNGGVRRGSHGNSKERI